MLDIFPHNLSCWKKAVPRWVAISEAFERFVTGKKSIRSANVSRFTSSISFNLKAHFNAALSCFAREIRTAVYLGQSRPVPALPRYF